MQKPILVPIEPSYGDPTTLLFMGGDLLDTPQSEAAASQWWWLIRALGWQGAIAKLEWDADIDLSLAQLSQAGEGAPAQWNHTRKQYKRIGKSFLPKLLWSAGISQVSLLAIAQGSQIAYYAMREWVERDIQIQDVILLAGLVKRDRDQDWPRVLRNIKGKLFNHYRRDDLMIHRFGRVLNWQRSACGIKPIGLDHPCLLNLDITSLMTTADYSAHSTQAALTQWVRPHWQQNS